VFYAAKAEAGAFAETLMRGPGRTLIPTDLLALKAYVWLRVVRLLILVKFSDLG
jgi:hypothetical protein